MVGGTVVIEGMVNDLVRFRPSDWAERLAGNLACYGPDKRLVFADELMPLIHNGIKCLRLEKSLAQSHPALFDEIMAFAIANQLTVIDDQAPAPLFELPLAS